VHLHRRGLVGIKHAHLVIGEADFANGRIEPFQRLARGLVGIKGVRLEYCLRSVIDAVALVFAVSDLGTTPSIIKSATPPKLRLLES
jgi:hypothetical protein